MFILVIFQCFCCLLSWLWALFCPFCPSCRLNNCSRRAWRVKQLFYSVLGDPIRVAYYLWLSAVEHFVILPVVARAVLPLQLATWYLWQELTSEKYNLSSLVNKIKIYFNWFSLFRRWYYGQILSPSHSDDVNSPKGTFQRFPFYPYPWIFSQTICIKFTYNTTCLILLESFIL